MIVKRSHILGSEIYHDAKLKLEKERKKGCCIICGSLLPPKQKKYCTNECRINWFKQFKPYFLWKEIRDKVFLRDNFTCKICGFKDEDSINYHAYINTGKLVADQYSDFMQRL